MAVPMRPYQLVALAIEESVKASVAKFNAEELIAKRENAKDVIAQVKRTILTANNIDVLNIS